MSRSEITDLLDRELVRLRLTKKNAYSFWAHEVWLDRYKEKGEAKRVDFMEFVPKGGPMYGDGPHVEQGIFTFYEVKSCMADLKSGHGLNFYGDENYLVMPVELYKPYLEESMRNEHLRQSARLARCMLYGIGRNGKPTFWAQDMPMPKWYCRTRSASELLFCMMRAMIANSDHSNVNHAVRRM
jgi:hypothetical protein